MPNSRTGHELFFLLLEHKVDLERDIFVTLSYFYCTCKFLCVTPEQCCEDYCGLLAG